jgi:two-component system, NtrC family, response regulator AtoC
MPDTSSILVVDDEELIRWSLREHLLGEGFRVLEAEDGLEALDIIEKGSPDLVIMDLKMPRMDGMELLRRLREADHDLPVIVITAYGAVESAIEATRLGARAFIHKPFDLREVVLAVRQVLDTWRLETEVRYLRRQTEARYGQIIGQSMAMCRLFDTLRRLEHVDAPTVLLAGESGTGKDLIARAIHDAGPRKTEPYMEVDCASLPEQLIESELFGHEKGSFTDARSTKRGLFEVARSGTLFLDEIGEMSLPTQAKLLRAIENRKFKRVGGVVDLPVEAGIIAATNRDVAVEVKKGRFREDLYFRLNVIRIEVPPLRDRRDDIPPLVDYFISRFNAKFGRNVRGVSREAMDRLQAWPWPGNVRELRNVLERVVILEADDIIQAMHLPPEIRFGRAQAEAERESIALPEGGIDLERVELSFLHQAMERTGGNQSAAARLLGISRFALRYRLEKHGLPRGTLEG